MTPLQRIARRLRRAWAALNGRDHVSEPLPRPVVSPRPSVEELCQRARQRGLDDAERLMYDGWSFGSERDLSSTVLDPPQVRSLREECQVSLRTLRDNQNLTLARLGDVQAHCVDADTGMAAARRRMGRAAAREAQVTANSFVRYLARRRVQDLPVQRAIDPDSYVWEGMTRPLGPQWRALILLFLTGVVFAVQYFVLRLVAADSQAEAEVAWTAGAMALICVLGPHVSGLLLRHRQATGHSRTLTAMSVLLLAPAAVLVGIFGVTAGRLFGLGLTPDAVAGQSRAAQHGVSPTTLVVAFEMVLVIALAMSYMLGLARPHPFQQAYAHYRDIRDDAYNERIRRGTTINLDFRAPTPPRIVRDDDPEDGIHQDDEANTTAGNPTAELEQAITHAYYAAEEAYFEGLITGMADPAFTEAVVRRRELRRPDPPAPVGGPNGSAPSDSLDDHLADNVDEEPDDETADGGARP